MACGSALDSALSVSPGGDSGVVDRDATSPFGEGGNAVPATIDANAIVLVHAASFPAFRVCFAGMSKQVPEPSADLLPDSNVVGVDVGTAVRLPPTSITLGRAFVFPEPILRPFYPAFGGAGPSCETLLGSIGTNSYAIEVGNVTDDLSHGVHALVLSGCRGAAVDPAASADRCGSDWNSASGNLKLTTVSLTAYVSPGDARLSVQLLQLSPSLERAAQGRALGLAFGSLDSGIAPEPFVEGVVPRGQPVPNPPAIVQYASSDLASYATSGMFVTLGGALDDSGAPFDAGADASREVIVAQSLADIQKRSSPRSLPSDWFGVASSYVLLSVGDPDPRLADGGKDDDARRTLHLLAIPLAGPDTDAAAPP